MADKTSLPSTEPHHAPIFDTGPHPDPLKPLTDQPEAESSESSIAFSELENFDTDAFLRPVNGSLHAEPVVVPPDPPGLTDDELHAAIKQVLSTK